MSPIGKSVDPRLPRGGRPEAHIAIEDILSLAQGNSPNIMLDLHSGRLVVKILDCISVQSPS